MDFSSPQRFGGGGGFFSSSQLPTNDHSPNASGIDRKKTQQSLTPVTCRQIELSDIRDKIRIDNKEVGQLLVIGQIIKEEIKSTHVEYYLTDSTTIIPLQIRVWIDGDENNNNNNYKKRMREKISVHLYAKAIGNLRMLGDEKVFMAMSMVPISDFNEITYHYLDVLHTHLRNTRGPLSTLLQSSSNNNNASMNQSSSNMMMGGGGYDQYGGGNNQSFNNSSMSHNVMNNNNNNNHSPNRNGLSPFQSTVLEVVQSGSRDDTGCSVQEIIRRLIGKFSEIDIREQVTFLVDQGHLFTTIDEDHVKLI